MCFIDGVRPEIIGCSDGSIQYQVRASNQVCHVCVPYGSALSLLVWSGYDLLCSILSSDVIYH